MARPLFAMLLLLGLTGCGYSLGSGSCLPDQAKVEVPYVCGDEEGWFTQALVRALASQSSWQYAPRCGQYRLEVTLHCVKIDPIGYRYEQNYEGELGKRLVASEERLVYRAEVVIRQAGRICHGPFCIEESIDLDFAPETSPQNQTTFSLGQLDFENAARRDALLPLYERLAKKIIDFLNAGWYP